MGPTCFQRGLSAHTPDNWAPLWGQSICKGCARVGRPDPVLAHPGSSLAPWRTPSTAGCDHSVP